MDIDGHGSNIYLKLHSAKLCQLAPLDVAPMCMWQLI